MNLKTAFFAISTFLSASMACSSDDYNEEPGATYTRIRVYDSEENPYGIKFAVTNTKGEDSFCRLPFTSNSKTFEHNDQDHFSIEKTTYSLQLGSQVFTHSKAGKEKIPYKETLEFEGYKLPGGERQSCKPNFFYLNLWDTVTKEVSQKFLRPDGTEYSVPQSKIHYQAGPFLNDAFVEPMDLHELGNMLPANQYVPVVLKVSGHTETTYLDKDHVQYYVYKKVSQDPSQGTVTICHQHGKEIVWRKGTQLRHARKYYSSIPVTTYLYKSLLNEEGGESSVNFPLHYMTLLPEEKEILLVLDQNPHRNEGYGYQEKLGIGFKNSPECSVYNADKPNFGLPANYKFAS